MSPGVVHRYRAVCSWQGSTATGYEAYSRAHLGGAPPASQSLAMTSDPAFRGDPDDLNPEQLFLLAASSCQLLSFLAVAARARLDVTAYEDEAEAIMPGSGRRLGITEIHLRPRITVSAPATEQRVLFLTEVAHRECFIANSISSQMTVTPTVFITGSDPVPHGDGELP